MSRRPRAWGTLLTALVAFVYAWTPLGDRDWPWHLADFGRMVRERALPWHDAFAWGSEGDFVPVHWAFELGLGAAHRAFGLLGIELVRVSLVVLAFAFLQRLVAKRGLGPLASSALALTVAAVTRNRLLERPHLVTLLGIVLLWDRLLAFREDTGGPGAEPPNKQKKTAWELVPLLGVWANMHPGVVYGAGLALGFAGFELLRVPLATRFPSLRALPARRAGVLALWAVLGVAATLATPYGLRLYPYLFEHLGMQRLQHVAELRPLDFSSGWDHAFLAALVIATLLLIQEARAGDPPDLTELLGSCAFVGLAVLAAREANLALVCVAVMLAPVLAESIAQVRAELEGRDRGLHVFAWGFGLLLGFGLPVGSLGLQLWEGELGSGLEQGHYPVLEADWILEKKPHGKLWNTNASGGYLLWRLDPLANPEWRVFTDGRQPLFGHAVNRTFKDIEEKDAPNLLVLDPLSPPWEATDFLEKFVLVHFSDGGRTYLRREGRDRELVERFAYRHIAFCAVRDPSTFYGVRLGIGHDSENPDEAKRELLTRALAEEPGGHWANLALAGILLEAGDKPGAAAAARRALAVRANKDAAEILLRASR